MPRCKTQRSTWIWCVVNAKVDPIVDTVPCNAGQNLLLCWPGQLLLQRGAPWLCTSSHLADEYGGVLQHGCCSCLVGALRSSRCR